VLPPATLIVGQSGGPTAVINASLAGVIRAARAAGIRRLLGLRFGVEGLLAGDFSDLTGLSDVTLDRLPSTPAAMLGSCRRHLGADDLEAALGALRRERARWLIYIGGNDSADTSHQLHRAAAASGLDLAVVGVPKTIDNDLPLTDHCPGYGSAARFIAQMTAEAGLDTETMRRTDPIKLIEVMGRHAGWLAAAAWLGRRGPDSAPHLVYLPERPRSEEVILAEVEAVYRRLGYCVVVLCENQPDPSGAVLGACDEPLWTDSFGHAYYDSPAQYLARLLRQHLRVRTRVDKPGTIQRMSIAHQSSSDRREAELAGAAAVALALAGRSDLMVTLTRESEQPYRCGTATAPLADIANLQRLLPDEFIAADGHSLTAAFERYALPLLGDPLPEYAIVA
jgi:ATP-dependent phosphofructokinase / diphosphate-dependent phosphofructokinase